MDSNSEDNAVVFDASGQVHRIDSNICPGIKTVYNPENLVCATLDWEHVSDNPTYEQHHDMFMRFYHAETYELVDLDGLHPFCLVSQFNADE